jgi:hypothetical protein
VEDTALVLSTAEDMFRLLSEEDDEKNDDNSPAVQNCLGKVGIILASFRSHLDALHKLLEERLSAHTKSGCSSPVLSQARKAAMRSGKPISGELDSLKENMRECRNNLICSIGTLSNMRQHQQQYVFSALPTTRLARPVSQLLYLEIVCIC